LRTLVEKKGPEELGRVRREASGGSKRQKEGQGVLEEPEGRPGWTKKSQRKGQTDSDESKPGLRKRRPRKYFYFWAYDGLTRSPGRSQKDGLEDQNDFKQLGWSFPLFCCFRVLQTFLLFSGFPVNPSWLLWHVLKALEVEIKYSMLTYGGRHP
jgi:hypothetical protein